MLAVGMPHEHRWSKNPELSNWIAQSRLDAFSAMASSGDISSTFGCNGLCIGDNVDLSRNSTYAKIVT